jgi:hypothetical protein
MTRVCPLCNIQIDVPAAALGKKVRCPSCQAEFVLPSVSVGTPAAAPAPAAEASVFDFDRPDDTVADDESPSVSNELNLKTGVGRPLGHSVGVVFVGLLLTFIVASILGIGAGNSRGVDQVVFGASAALLGLLGLVTLGSLLGFLGSRSLALGIIASIGSGLCGLMGLGGIGVTILGIQQAHERAKYLLVGFGCFCAVQGIVCIAGGAATVWFACRPQVRALLARDKR